MINHKGSSAGRTLISFLLVSVLCLGAMFLSVSAADGNAAETERSVSIENIAASGTEFSCDVHLAGEPADGDKIIVSLFSENGRMIKARILDAEASVHVSFSQVSSTDRIKAMWVDSSNAPQCAGATVECREQSIYGSMPSKQHVVKGDLEIDGQKETVTYIDNEVLLEAAEGVTREQIEELAQQYGGRIVGEMQEIGHYQIEFVETPDADKYSSILKGISESGLVQSSTPNTVIDFVLCSDYQHIPDDPWSMEQDKTESWNEGYPSGTNWGLEAINVPSAWQLLCDKYGSLDKLPQIPTGVFDYCFDYRNSDLLFSDYAVYDTSAEPDADKASEVQGLAGSLSYAEAAEKGLLHGTHVAGIISAVHDSDGTSGIAGSQPMYAYAFGPSEQPVTLNLLKSGLGWLIEKSPNGKMVINVSLNDGQADKVTARAVASMLVDYLDEGKDFLIVSAAGNDDGKSASEASILNSITDFGIMDRIIVAGAVKKYDAETGLFAFYGKSETGEHFNYGDRIDVSAPGDDILSTVPATADGSDTGLMDGTSAAAAHVTGTAALVWAANPDLSGALVKEILMETADISLLEVENGEPVSSRDAEGNTHPMINAAHAVAEALGQPYEVKGTCGREGDGSNLAWEYDFSTGTLTVYGNGEMQNFESASDSDIPWHRWGREIRNITVEDGVTSVGDNAFSCISGRPTAYFGKTVSKIGKNVFAQPADMVFAGSAPEAAAATSENPSFDADSAIRYPEEFQNSWDPDKDGTWNGYSVQPTGRYSIAGSVISAETSEPVGGAEVSILNRSEHVVKSGSADDNGKFELKLDFDPADSILLIRKDGFVSLYLDLATYSELPAGLFEGTELAPEQMFSASGKCGRYLSWGLAADGTLCFNGSGDMDDFNRSDYIDDLGSTRPWNDLKDTVKTFRVLNGSNLTSIGKAAFYECLGLTGSITIPDSVTSIGAYAFLYCRGLTGDLVIPESVTSIGQGAFWNCSGFTGSLVIPGSITSISSEAFSGCSGFNGGLIIPDSVTSIGEDAFSHCSGFTGSLTIPDSVTSIGYWAFFGCSGFTGDLIIPDGVTSIETSVFSHCSGFNGSLTIPDSVTSIGPSAFSYCSGFTGELIIPDGVTRIESAVFENCSGFTGELNIPDGVTSIETAAFSGCSGFTGELNIPDGVTNIGGGAFDGCSGFTGELIIPDGVTTIENYTFRDCSGFTGDLIIPDSVTSIWFSPFDGCKGLDGDLIIPDSVTSIWYESWDGDRLDAFHGCKFANAYFFGDRLDGAFFGLPYSCKIHYNENASGWPADDLNGYEFEQEPFDPAEFQFPV